MSKINTIFNQVFRPLSVQESNNEEFTQGTMRKQFIHELVTHTGDLKMTKAGAASYYQLCRKRAAGEDMYASHKKWNKANAKPATPTVNVDMDNRWMVGNKETKSVFASFTTRTAAQAHNKELAASGIDSNWIDATKINIAEFKPAIAA